MPKLKSTRLYLTPDEVQRLLNACSTKQDRMLFTLLFATGCRVSELLVLTPANIDYERQTLDVPALKRKAQASKFVTVTADTLLELGDYCKGKKHGSRLFSITRQQAYYRIRMAGKRAGIDGVYLHLLRDSFAIQWAKAGGDISILARQLGHKSESTTRDRYLRWSTEDILAEHERISR